MTAISLAGMVDLALGTPEVGAVNFTMLHKLLHAMLHKLSISDVKEDIDDHDKDFLATTIPEKSPEAAKTKPQSQRRTSHYHELENKVEKIQQKLIDLDALPSNRELFERAKGEQPKPVNDMWKSLQLTKKVEANESGVSKLMSLVGDLMKEMQLLKDENKKLKQETKDLRASGDDMLKKLQHLEETFNMLTNQFGDLPTPDIFMSFVTWPGLEDALKGIRQEMTEQQIKYPEDVTAVDQPALQNQFTPSPRPVSAVSKAESESRPPSAAASTDRRSSRASTTGPSNELGELLERLGCLASDHQKLEGRVSLLEAKMKNKVDIDKLKELGLGGHSDDLEKRIKTLEEQISGMKRLREKSPTTQTIYMVSKRSDEATSRPSTKSVPSLPTVKTASTPLQATPPRAASPPADKQALVPPNAEGPSRTPSVNDVSSEEIMKELQYSQLQRDQIMKQLQCSQLEHDRQKAFIRKCRTDIDLLLEKDPVIWNTFEKLSDSMMELREKAMLDAKGDRLMSSRLDGVDQQLENIRDMLLNAATGEPSSEKEVKPEPPRRPVVVQGGVNDDAITDLQYELTRNSDEIRNLQNRFRLMNKETNRQLNEAQEQFGRLNGDMDAMNAELQRLRTAAKPQDSDALSRMQQAILQLQAELDRLSVSTQQLIDDNNMKQTDIDSLYNLCKSLEEHKADKLFVQKEVDVKADRTCLDGKVNKAVFDTTLDDLNKLISDILGKLSGHEEEWRKAMGQLSNDIDGKLDRLEFSPIREELERQLKMLSRKLKALDMGHPCDDDAAGIRKQLIQRFHCISCDRQVDMMPQPPMASIPNPGAMPGTRSARPYTVFELDQIRQQMRKSYGKGMTHYERAVFARQLARLRMQDFRAFVVHFGKDMQDMSKGIINLNQNQNQLDIADVYATSRSCGGSHTTTFPHRRITRVCNQGWKEDDPTIPMQPQKPEMGIQGADGHIYRGQPRQGVTSPTPLSARAATSRGPREGRQRPSSAQVSRPSSARVTSRPQSAVSRDFHPTTQSTDPAVFDHSAHTSEYDLTDGKIDAMLKPLDNFTEAS